jgi:hypothetical protein
MNSIIGKIQTIGQTQTIPSKNGGRDLVKRELVLDASAYDRWTGDKFDNFPSFEFIGQRCADLDNFKAGDIVTVSFDIRGRFYDKDGEKKHMNSVVGFRIEKKELHPGNVSTTEETPTPENITAEESKNDLPF